MSELQPGMLALVIGCYKRQENIGRVVTLGDRVPFSYREAYGDGFFAKGLSNAEWALSKHLIPIPPIADPLDVTHKEELHA